MDENRRRGPGAYLFWGFLIGVGFCALVDASGIGDLASYLPEVFGIGVTVGVLEQLNKRRAQRDLEAQLMRRIRSSVRDVAVAALEELEHLGVFKTDMFVGAELRGVQWTEASLFGANLERADLRSSCLEGAVLFGAILRRARLQKTDLKGADLRLAKLEGAFLQGADLKGADLRSTHLKGAFLFGIDTDLQRVRMQRADLQGVRLFDANLGEANFQAANLEGAQLENARPDENTVLPDGSKWTPGTDITRFTNPDHPDFWRSGDPLSPAYRGDDK